MRTKYKPECNYITYGESSIEKLWIKIKFGAYAVFYRPPKTKVTSVLEQLGEVLSFVLPSVDYVVCLEHINVNHFNLNNPITECFGYYGFYQVINEPTRVTTTTAALLDPI